MQSLKCSLLLPGVLFAGIAWAQSPVQSCNDDPQPSWCNAVSGDRSQGWLTQHRSEVMARNGIVATSQPLAAQAGLDILKKGGNAVDAAVATAAMLSVVEPMNVGPAGDMFAIVYIAKENKLYALNASGKAPSGPTVARMKKLGYVWNASNWGPVRACPTGGILTVTVPGAVWGWDEVQRRFGSLTFKETLQPAIDYAEQGFPISERIAHDWKLPKGLSDDAERSARSAARNSIPIRSRRGTSTASSRRPGRFIAIPDSRRPSASCSSKAATASTRARSRRRSSTSRSATAAR